MTVPSATSRTNERGFWQRVRDRLLDQDRYCKTCGSENAVDAVAEHDPATGAVKRFRWGVACPKSNVSFTTKPGYGRGNGYLHEHYYALADQHQPSWLDPAIAERLMADADDYGYLGESHIPSQLAVAR